MIELFIEVTDQLFWQGYTEQLSKEQPERFSLELNDFLDNYNSYE
jgi:hypothetical protein